MGQTQDRTRREKAEAGIRLAAEELARIEALLDAAATRTDDRFPRAILKKNVERAGTVRLELLGVVGILRAAGAEDRRSA